MIVLPKRNVHHMPGHPATYRMNANPTRKQHERHDLVMCLHVPAGIIDI
jgi:hypothetical protein